jgi:hypothetical protein
VGLVLDVSFLDCQHGWYVVEPNTDPERYLKFSRLIIPGISTFCQWTFCTFKACRTKVNELFRIYKFLLLDSLLIQFQNKRVLLSTPLKCSIEDPLRYFIFETEHLLKFIWCEIQNPIDRNRLTKFIVHQQFHRGNKCTGFSHNWFKYGVEKAGFGIDFIDQRYIAYGEGYVF